jgi:hypothetical protein
MAGYRVTFTFTFIKSQLQVTAGIWLAEMHWFATVIDLTAGSTICATKHLKPSGY